MVEWITLFCKRLSCSQSFTKALEQQLAAQAAADVGIDLRNGGFFLVPPEQNSPIQYDQENIGYLDTYLVGPDANAHPVTIAWRCEEHHDERIMPANEISTDVRCRLQVWWKGLPVDKLKRYARPIGPPWPKSVDFLFEPVDFSFEIEWWAFSWPDVWLELQAQKVWSSEQICQIQETLIQTREDWNNQKPDRGKVHHISKLRHIAANRLEAYIDFGSAHKSALISFFHALQKKNTLFSIERATMRGHPIVP